MKKLLQKKLSGLAEEVNNLTIQLAQSKKSEASRGEARQKEKLEGEIALLQNQLLKLSSEASERRRKLDKGMVEKGSGQDSIISLVGHMVTFLCKLSPFFQQRNGSQQLNNSVDGKKASTPKLIEGAGLQEILSLLEAKDADVQLESVKAVANMAHKETNKVKIVKAGGVTSLLLLLHKSEDESIRRVAAAAIADIATNAFYVPN